MVLFGYDQGVVAEFGGDGGGAGSGGGSNGEQDGIGGPYMSGAIGGVARESKL